MTVTLKDIAESEKICEAATEGFGARFDAEWSTEGPYVIPSRDADGFAKDYIKVPLSQSELIAHARTQLPAMNELVREMLGIIEELVGAVEHIATISQEMVAHNFMCESEEVSKARRLVERMEGGG